jgi:hypothetical protein
LKIFLVTGSHTTIPQKAIRRRTAVVAWIATTQTFPSETLSFLGEMWMEEQFLAWLAEKDHRLSPRFSDFLLEEKRNQDRLWEGNWEEFLLEEEGRAFVAAWNQGL